MKAPRTRELGRTGLELSTVGLGTWAMGGGWGERDDAASIETMARAVELGVNWFDTAPYYGHGHAEELVGEFLRRVPSGQRPYVFTKGGSVWKTDDLLELPEHTLRPESIYIELEASLRRLGVDVIDMYQFHWPDDSGIPVEESWGMLASLVDEGKVRFAGLCNHGTSLLQQAEAVRHVDSVQPPFSLINRRAAADILPWCEEQGAGAIVYSPLQSGLLNGRINSANPPVLGDGDWRHRNKEFHEPNLSKNLALIDGLGSMADERGVTLLELAIAWTVAWPGVTGAIVGARLPEHVDGWLGASGLDLEVGELAAIGDLLGKTGAGAGPVVPIPG